MDFFFQKTRFTLVLRGWFSALYTFIEFRWRIFSFEEIFGLHDAEIVPMDRALEILFRIDLEDK